MYQNFFKKILDFSFAVLCLIFFFPLMMIIYLILLILIGSPIFIHKRPGFNNKIFHLYKFKTIIDKDCKASLKKKKFFEFGKYLRKTGLDELPQLINVLKGDISFVGPRPLLIKYLKISAFKKHVRKKCKPGITGLAQLETFNLKKKEIKLKWKKQFELDKYYYGNISFCLDLRILLLTLFNLVRFSSKKDYYGEPKLLSKYIK